MSIWRRLSVCIARGCLSPVFHNSLPHFYDVCLYLQASGGKVNSGKTHGVLFAAFRAAFQQMSCMRASAFSASPHFPMKESKETLKACASLSTAYVHARTKLYSAQVLAPHLMCRRCKRYGWGYGNSDGAKIGRTIRVWRGIVPQTRRVQLGTSDGKSRRGGAPVSVR